MTPDTILRPRAEPAQPMPAHGTSREHHMFTKYPPILVGVPTIHRINIGNVYQVTPTQPHVLAFPFIRQYPCRIDILLTASNHATRLRVRSAAHGLWLAPGNFHAAYALNDDAKAPLFVMFENLDGLHKLIIKTSYEHKDRAEPLVVTNTLLVQQTHQPHLDFRSEVIERFRFRLQCDIRQNLIITDQLVDPQYDPNANWDHVTECINQCADAKHPRPTYASLAQLGTFLKDLDCHTAQQSTRTAALCMLIESVGSHPDTVEAIKGFIIACERDDLDITPLCVRASYRRHTHPHERRLISITTGRQIKPEPMDQQEPCHSPSVRSASSTATSAASMKQENQDTESDYA